MAAIFMAAGAWLSRPALAGWWPDGGTAWLNRKQLTLTNNSGGNLNANAVVTVTIDTQSLYTLGKLKSDCSDLRIVYNPNSTTYKDLNRYVGFPSGTTCSTSTTSKVSFALQAAVNNAASSTDYYLYYNNPDASTATNDRTAFSIGSANATFVCSYDNTTTCLAAGTATPTLTSGTARYAGSKSALRFDGAGDYITTGNIGSDIKTVEFWVYPTSTTNYFVDLNGSAYISASAGTISATGFTSPVYYVNGAVSSTITANTWQHIAVTTATAINASSTNIGKISTNYLAGYMDELRISNSVRYSAAFTTTTIPFVRDSNTKLLYHFDEIADDIRVTGKTIDDSGNGNNGTITGAKFVGGLVGVDTTTSDTGNVPRQSYAGHEGMFFEAGVTNKITNPGFENATYNLNWTAGANLTATQNTTAPYYKFGSNSANLVASATAISGTSNMFYININAGSTSTHALSAYVYNGTSGAVGGTVDATVAKLVYNGAAVTTTYVDQGGGWWQLIYTAAGINAAADYGVEVQVSKTVYVDAFQLELPSYAYATTYADGSLGTGYAWTGTANNSTSTRDIDGLKYSNTSNISGTAGTMSLWLDASKTNAFTAGLKVFVSSGDTTAGYKWILYKQNAVSNLTYYTTDSCGTFSNDVTYNNGWNHIVMTWSSGTFKMYFNGTLQANTLTGGCMNFGNNGLEVGPLYSTGFNYAPNATISDFRIYDAAITANDISDLYYSGLVGHSENIVLDRFGGGDTKGQDPLAVWHMDEGYGTTINDSSRNNKPLTASGTTWESGVGNTRSSRARFLKFDGSTSYLSRAQDSDFDFGTGSFSASGWFRHTSTAPASGTHTILARYGTAGFKVYMNTSGYVCFGIDADSTWSPTDTACSGAGDGSLADSKWHHLEAVKNGATSISLYIDGHLAQTTTVTATGTMNTSSILYLGVDSTGNYNYWNGWQDEFMIYTYARSAAQIKTDLLDPVAVLIGYSANDRLTQGLVGYWKMEDVNDSSGNSVTLTNNGTTTFVGGKYGNASNYNGSSQYLSTATTISGVQTVSFWANPASTTDNYINLASGVYINSSSGTISATGVTSPTIYVNGAISSTIAASTWSLVTVTTNTAISASSFETGRANGSYYGNGSKLDDVRIYNRALSPREVRDLYNWAPGPVGYWNFDEHSGQTINDTSGNSFAATLGANSTASTDDPVWTTGKYGGGLNFDGVNDYVNVGNMGTFPSTGSISFWMNPNVIANYNNVFDTDNNLNAGIRFEEDSTGKFSVVIAYVGSPDIHTYLASGLVTNVWRHVTLVWNTGSNTVVGYLDGIQVFSEAQTNWPSTLPAVRMGTGYSSARFWNGKLDDVRIYNYARTQKQIVEDMNAGHPSVGSPVGSAVGYWKFDEGADNTCPGGTNDACNSGSVGSALDGPQTGMATPATSTSGWTNSGKFGKALLFDGTDDKIAIPDHADFTLPGDFTIQAWIQTTSSGGTILGSYTNTGDIYWQFENSGGHPQLLYKVTQDGATQSILGTGKLINDGAWHHVAGIRDGSTLYAYVDGVLDNTATDKLTTSINPVNPTNIGNSTTPANYFTGTIDEVKLYHYALTADEIRLDYNRGSVLVMGSLGDNSSYQKQAANQEYCVPGDATSCVTPLAEWKFDEGTSTSAFDSTGNGVTGTLVNSPAWIAGKQGKSLNFNGSNSYVTTTHQDALFNGITTAMTISGWVKPAAGSLSARRDIIQRAGAVGSINGATAAKDIWWFNLQNSGKMNFYMGGITGAYVETTTAISDSVWTYLTVTYDGSNIRFYINGKLDKTSAASGTLLTGDNGVGIGGNLSGVSPATVFSGGIDMLRVWGYTRSPAQIAYDYNRGGPAAWYKFDECTGGSANDTSGNGNTGTITVGVSGSQTSTGTCGTSTTTEAWNNGTTGKRNASINLDGNDDYVATGAFSPLATAAVTTAKASWGGWFYPTSSAASLTLMEKATEFRLTTDASSKPVCGIYYSAAFNDATAGSTTLTLSAWNHVLCTYDGANIKTYLNGILVGTTANTNNITAASSILYMGENSSGAQRLTGQLDDLRIYAYPLTATQIKTLINEGAVRFGPATGSP